MADDALRFAERVIALVESGKKSATYKLATLLALIDVTAEHTTVDGPPDVLSAREVGRRVIELYWPQTRVFPVIDGHAPVLKQSPQNDIPAKLAAFRHRHRLSPAASIEDARRADPDGWRALEADLVGIVVGMPLAKLQRFGDGARAVEDRFIYDFGWRDEVSPSAVGRAGFDDRIHLRPGVGGWLVRLAPLLRPLVEAKWAELVARRNVAVVDQFQLTEFLFGASRISLDRAREPLREVQSNRCFYCRSPLGAAGDVDHFVPWSRHPDNTLDNLVLAHAACNNAKSSSIAGHEHLEAWMARTASPALDDIAAVWPRRRDRTLGAVHATYLWLPADAWLWRARGEYERVDPERVRGVLGAA